MRAAASGVIPSLVGIAVIDVVEGKNNIYQQVHMHHAWCQSSLTVKECLFPTQDMCSNSYYMGKVWSHKPYPSQKEEKPSHTATMQLLLWQIFAMIKHAVCGLHPSSWSGPYRMVGSFRGRKLQWKNNFLALPKDAMPCLQILRRNFCK